MFSFFFFFSSRRRHTRWPRDWSSDVCSSDLSSEPSRREDAGRRAHGGTRSGRRRRRWCRPRSEERRVGKSVDLGGRRIIKKKKLGLAKCHRGWGIEKRTVGLRSW